VSVPSDLFIVSIDVGSSSVRTLLFDSSAHQMEGFGAQLAYRIQTTPDGGAEVDPEALADLTIDCLDELHRQVQEAGFRVAAVAGSAFWHSFCGVDATGKPTLPILHLLDTRSGDQVARVPDAHARTGCVPHSSYWPAKLLWLAENRPGTKVIMLNAAAGWCSPCKREAAALADFAADYQAAGVVVLTAIFQDQEGRPADEDFARTWAHTFGLGTPVLIDATFATGRWFDVGTMPANMFVDARTGEILEIATGAETDADPMKVYRDLLDHYLATR